MAIDLSALSNFSTSAKGLSDLILVNPIRNAGYQPQALPNKDGTVPPNPPKFLFHYEGENVVSLDSDITDHYVEDNTAINDHIALAPEMIKTQGFIGELNDVTPEPLEEVRLAAEKLFSLSAYEPGLSVTALNAYNKSFQAYQAAQSLINSAVSTYDSINGAEDVEISGNESEEELLSLSKGKKTQNKQQLAFQQFYGYWRNRTLFTVQTPWAVFKNMAIKSLRAIQDSETNAITSFEVDFKIIRFATSNVFIDNENAQVDASNFQGRAYNQASPLVDLGTSKPKLEGSISDVLSQRIA